MNAATLRKAFGSQIEHLSSEVLNGIVCLTHPSMRTLDDTFLNYLRCWIVAENYVDAVEKLGLAFNASNYDDCVDAEEDAHFLIIKGKYIYFTTYTHEVVVLTLG
jgi:hypothetical protein